MDGIDPALAQACSTWHETLRGQPWLASAVGGDDAQFEAACRHLVQAWADSGDAADGFIAGLLALRAERAAAMADLEDAPLAPVLSLIAARSERDHLDG